MSQWICWMPARPVHLNLPFSHADFVTSLAERLETAFSSAGQCGADAHKELQFYDGAVHHQSYVEGDLVWLHNPIEDHRKLAPL